MDKRLHDNLIQDINSLKKLLANCSTETIVGTVATKFLRWPNNDVELTSPHRQLFYLLTLMLTSPEPKNSQEFDESAWSNSQDLLEKIFRTYAWMFWPTADEAKNLTKEWKDIRKVAMPAFLNYFNSGLLASTDQVKDRINRYIVPFDSAVKAIFDLTMTDMLDIVDFIGGKIQSDYDSLSDLIKKEEQARLARRRVAVSEAARIGHIAVDSNRQKVDPFLIENLTQDDGAVGLEYGNVILGDRLQRFLVHMMLALRWCRGSSSGASSEPWS